MGINEVNNQTGINSGTGYYEEEPKKVVTPKIEIGAALINKSEHEFAAGTLGLGAEINLGKGWTVEPELNGYAGEKVTGCGAKLEVGKQINPQLQLNVGVGFDKTKFSNTSQLLSVDVSGGSENLPDDLRNMATGDYMYGGIETSYTRTKTGQTTTYATIGAQYAPNKKLTFAANIELGRKSLDGDFSSVTKNYTGIYCTEGAKTEIMQPENIPVYVSDAKTTPFSYSEIKAVDKSQTSFTSRIGLGAEYKINDHLSAGLNGQIGLNKNSDDFLGAKIAYRF